MDPVVSKGGMGHLEWRLMNNDLEGRRVSNARLFMDCPLFSPLTQHKRVGPVDAGQQVEGSFKPRIDHHGSGELAFAVCFEIDGIRDVVYGRFPERLKVQEDLVNHQTIIVSGRSKLYNVGEMQSNTEKAEPDPISGYVLPNGARQMPSPPGQVMTGAHGFQWRRVSDEIPVWLMMCPLTQSQWERITGESFGALVKAAESQVTSVNEVGVGPSHPLYYIQPSRAETFCKELQRCREELGFDDEIPLGYDFRLPTVAEWVAAFGSIEYPIDLEAHRLQGWTKLESGGRTRPVGTLSPNENGFYDMLGNTFEICGSAEDGYFGLGGSWYRGSGDTAERKFFESGRPAPLTPSTASSRIGVRIALGPIV